MAAVFGWSMAVYPVLAQTQPAPAIEPVYSLADLEYILGPIALYPDPLLAIRFPATAFPDQIVEGYTWIEATRLLKL